MIHNKMAIIVSQQNSWGVDSDHLWQHNDYRQITLLILPLAPASSFTSPFLTSHVNNPPTQKKTPLSC